MSIKVLLATNVDDLDDAIMSENGIEVVCKPVQYREAAVELAEQTKPDVAVISSWLEGNTDIIDVVYKLRSLDIRVIFIAGTLTSEDLTVKRILELGVYDILWGEIRIGQVLEKIFDPTPASKGLSLMGVNKSGYKEKKQVQTPVTDDFDSEPENEEGTKSPFSKLAKISGDLRKSIPSIPRLPKRSVNGKPLEKVVAVCSPVPAGKTFVAVNLAAAMAQEGHTVALVDADYKKFGVHTWLNCPAGEEGLAGALQDVADPIAYAYQPGYLPGLSVFTSDPGEKTPLINDKSLIMFLQELQQHVDLVIVDTPGDFSAPITGTVINAAGLLVIVSDPDFSHLLRIQREIDNLPEDFDFDKCVIVANQIIESDKLSPEDAEKATGMKVSCTIPGRPRSVLESIKVGIPAVMFDRDIKQAFEKLLVNELAQVG